MKNNKYIIQLFFFLLLFSNFLFSQYNTNPYIFSIEEPPLDGCFAVYDVNGDTKPDYIFRSENYLYVYDHLNDNKGYLWKKEIPMIYTFEINAGNKFGVSDIDGDSKIEVVALNDQNEIRIYDAVTGTYKRTISISVDDTTQVAANMVLVNQRYPGCSQKNRDVIIQTIGRPDISTYWESINRTLIAVNLESGEEIWRLQQNDNVNDGIYEGYFGQRHGGPVCADIDLDGIDEIIGGNVIDYEKSELNIIIPGNYEYLWKRWVGVNSANKYIDHIDAIAVGDFRADIPGLEWIIVEEDHVPGPKDVKSWHTVMMSKNSILWRKETELFNDGAAREPQGICPGNFDNSFENCEVWNRSRFSIYNSSGQVETGVTGQHPWIYDWEGNTVADYAMEDVLPADFNPSGNGEGIAEVWTIDWTGGDKEFIAGMARHTHFAGFPGGNVVLLDAVTGEVIWTTLNNYPQIQASMLYVADISGDNREELIICDVLNDNFKIKVFANEDNIQDFITNKWRDPLYSRLKQSWNYYSPGSYTKGSNPSIFNVQVKDVTPISAVISWLTDEPCDSRIKYGFTNEYNEGDIQENTYVTKHEIELTDLVPESEYHYQIISENSQEENITSPDNIFNSARSVILLHPQGGETFYVDSLVTIQWRIPSGEYGVKIEISRDGGENWRSLFSGVSDDSSAVWQVDGPPSHHCLIRVSDEYGYFSDVTAREFMIMDTSKQLIFNPHEQVLEQGKISNAIMIELKRNSGDEVTLNYSYDLSLQTTSPTGEFSLDSLSWNNVSQVSIDSGRSSVTFFYKDNTIGNSEIIVSEMPAVGWKNDTLKNIVLLENTDFTPPEILYFYPFPGKRSIPVNSALQFKIGDQAAGTGIVISSLEVTIDGVLIEYDQSNIAEMGKNYLFDYIPEYSDQPKWVAVNIQCKDSVINYLDTTYTFLTGNSRIINSHREFIYPDGGVLINENNGVEVNFPSESVGDTLYFEIGETDSLPQLPDSTLSIGKSYYLGPPGLQFNKKITISLPYNNSILKKANVEEADKIPVYLYNFNNWKKLPVFTYNNKKISVKTNSTGYITFLLENEDYSPPELFYFFPFSYTRSVPINSPIQFKIGDTKKGLGIDFNTLKISVNSNIFEYDQSNIIDLGKNFLFINTPDSIDSDSNIHIQVQCQDSVFNKIDTTYTYITGNAEIIHYSGENIYPGRETIITSDTSGIQVIYPVEAVMDTIYCIIGETDTIPPLPDSAMSIGKYYYLGPPGLKFNKKITVSLPCNEDILNQAEVTGVDQLPVYQYNFNTWEKLSVHSFNDSLISIQTNSTGYISFCRISQTDVTEWIVEESEEHKWKLRQNYPNPFNPTTSIKYYLAEECFVTIQVYDLLGRFIKELVAVKQNSGYHSVEWDGTDMEGRNLPSGIYLLQMEVDNYTEMRKMILRR